MRNTVPAYKKGAYRYQSASEQEAAGNACLEVICSQAQRELPMTGRLESTTAGYFMDWGS